MHTGMFRVKQPQGGVWTGSGRGQGGSGGGLVRARTRQAAGWTLALGLMLAGCSSPEDIAQGTGVPQPPTPPAVPAPAPAPAAPGAAAFADNATKGPASREFAYNWPAEVSAVPELVGRLTGERDQLLAEQKAEWAAALAEFAGQDCVACTNRAFEKTWDVVADLPRYLSLSASFYAYTGGAHGNSAHDALVWDREAKAALDPKAMFRSPEALQTALGDPWCKALKAERMKRLGESYSDDGFFSCPPIADLTLLPGSAGKQAFDRIGLLAAPYVAGSYAEGTYEVTLPVTPAVLAAVKPEHKPAFVTAK